jgi:hypothetical protein
MKLWGETPHLKQKDIRSSLLGIYPKIADFTYLPPLKKQEQLFLLFALNLLKI